MTQERHSGANITASVILMNSSFLSMASRAPRTLSATSAAPRSSTQLDSSMMAASKASWFSLILKSREGSRSEFGKAIPLCGSDKRSSQKKDWCLVGRTPGMQGLSRRKPVGTFAGERELRLSTVRHRLQWAPFQRTVLYSFSAPLQAWGARGRVFESLRPDHIFQ